MWGAGVREGSRRADAGRADGCGPGCRPRQGGRGGRSLPVDPLLPSGQLLLLSRPLGPSGPRAGAPAPPAPYLLRAAWPLRPSYPSCAGSLTRGSIGRLRGSARTPSAEHLGTALRPNDLRGLPLIGELGRLSRCPCSPACKLISRPPIIPRAPRPPPPARPWGAPAQRLAPRGLPPRCLGHTCPVGRRADRARARPGRRRGRSCDSRRVRVSAGRAGDGAPHRAVGELRHLVSSAPQHPLH